MQTFAGIVRVSHMGERKADSEKFHADADQMEEIEAWAKAKGVRVNFLPPELDVSGGWSIEKRPSLLAAVEGIESGKYAGLVVAYLSRMGRSVTKQLATWDRVEAAGGEVVSVREGIDTSTASGKLQRNLLLAIDEHYREQHVEHFDRRRRIATEAGIWQSRLAPYGYEKSSDRRLEPGPKADKARAAFEDFLAGTVTVLDLAKRLKMTCSGIRMMLRNRVYLGELTVGKYTNSKAHPALIEDATFNAVQRKLGERVRPARSQVGTALLGGLVRCASCGHRMSRGASKGGFYYKCRRHHSGVECPAPAAINSEKLESYAEAIALVELDRLQVEASETTDSTDRIRTELAVAEGELSAYLSAVSAADVGGEAFATGARERREVVEAAQDALSVEMARRPGGASVGNGAEILVDLDLQERNNLLRSLFAVVIAKPVGRGRATPIPERVRVMAYGADVPLLVHHGTRAQGLKPIPFPDADGVGVLSVAASEDRLESAGSTS